MKYYWMLYGKTRKVFVSCSYKIFLTKRSTFFCFYHIVLKASFSQKNSATSIRVGPLLSNILFPSFQVEDFIFNLPFTKYIKHMKYIRYMKYINLILMNYRHLCKTKRLEEKLLFMRSYKWWFHSRRLSAEQHSILIYVE